MCAKYVIGLTGNIASGKTEAAQILSDLGADLIDADEVAHQALRAATPETAAVVRRFGSGVIASDGSVDRQALGRIVFADASAMADLEAIVHPATRLRILERVEGSRAKVVVIEAIKLIEGPLVDRVDAVWVVTAPRDLRIARLVTLRGLTPEEAAKRVDAQNPEAEKVRRADVVLRNDASVDGLRQQVEVAWRRAERAAERAL